MKALYSGTTIITDTLLEEAKDAAFAQKCRTERIICGAIGAFFFIDAVLLTAIMKNYAAALLLLVLTVVMIYISAFGYRRMANKIFKQVPKASEKQSYYFFDDDFSVGSGADKISSPYKKVWALIEISGAMIIVLETAFTAISSDSIENFDAFKRFLHGKCTYAKIYFKKEIK